MLPIELMKILQDSNYLVELSGSEGSLIASFPERVFAPAIPQTKIKYTCLDNGLQISDSSEGLEKSVVIQCPTYATRALAECDILSLCSSIGYSVEAVKIGSDNTDSISTLLSFPQEGVSIKELESQEEKILKCIKLCSAENVTKGEEESKRLNVYEGFNAIRNYIKDIYNAEED